MARDVARLDAVAIEDCFCYSISSEDMQDLMSRFREISDYLLRASLTRYMDRSLNELCTQEPAGQCRATVVLVVGGG